MTSYLVKQEFYFEEQDIMQKTYELEDPHVFSVKINNKNKRIQASQIHLCYNLADNTCCVKLDHIENGTSSLITLKCVNANFNEAMTEELDLAILRSVVSNKLSIVSLCEEETYLEDWND